MRRPAIAVTLMLLLGGCATGGLVEIPTDELPFPLARAETAEATGEEERTFSIAFVRGRRVIRVDREIATTLPLEEIAVRTLLVGPDEDELDRRLVTAIPEGTRLLGIQIFRGVAEVDLSQEFQAAAASEGFLLRVAQVVITLTGLEGITAVRLSIDGEVASVPIQRDPDVQIVQRPVTIADYARRLPPGG